MEKLFIIVTEQGSGYTKEVYFRTENDAKSVISQIADKSDDIRVKKIYSTDEDGKVEFYNPVFKDGGLQLEALPESKPLIDLKGIEKELTEYFGKDPNPTAIVIRVLQTIHNYTNNW